MSEKVSVEMRMGDVAESCAGKFCVSFVDYDGKGNGTVIALGNAKPTTIIPCLADGIAEFLWLMSKNPDYMRSFSYMAELFRMVFDKHVQEHQEHPEEAQGLKKAKKAEDQERGNKDERVDLNPNIIVEFNALLGRVAEHLRNQQERR
jgi:hypothetical protein